MKLCDDCKVNPVKVADTEKGDLCWRCYYILEFGEIEGKKRYNLWFGGNGIIDERTTDK